MEPSFSALMNHQTLLYVFGNYWLTLIILGVEAVTVKEQKQIAVLCVIIAIAEKHNFIFYLFL